MMLKQYQRMYVEYWLPLLGLLTQDKFHALFFQNYLTWTLHDCKNDQFLALDKDDISVAAFKAKFYALSCYTTQLLAIEEERIRWYVKFLNYDLQVLFEQMIFARKGFNEVSDYVEKLQWITQVCKVRCQL